MNANELADKQAFEQGELSMWIRNETAAMLRQQQAEIAELKHMNKNWQISEGMALQEIEFAKEFLKANELYLSYVEWRHKK